MIFFFFIQEESQYFKELNIRHIDIQIYFVVNEENWTHYVDKSKPSNTSVVVI